MRQDIYKYPELILQKLIQFNTSNPPGNEAGCIKFIKELLKKNGIKSTILASDKNRPNLVARIKGNGNKSPLLLYGHVDVVPANIEQWRYSPFEGRIVNGNVWGRGALDMKGADAMILSSILKIKKEKLNTPGDIIICFTSDEEDKSEAGAKFLVDRYADYFKDVKYGISEFGGFPIYIGNKKFYLIEVAQKQICRLQIDIKGESGHGSSKIYNNATIKLAQLLKELNRNMPFHLIPIVKNMLKKISINLSFPENIIFYSLLNPILNSIIFNFFGDNIKSLYPLFHNIINPTIINSSKNINVIPGKIELLVDGRVLPGITSKMFLKQVKKMISGKDINIKILQNEIHNNLIDMSMFPVFEKIISDLDPNGIAIPYLMPACSDSRFFSKIGIQTYGFIPMNLPKGINFMKKIHSSNECIPISALHFGTKAITQLIQSF